MLSEGIQKSLFHYSAPDSSVLLFRGETMKLYRCAIDGIIRKGFPVGNVPLDNLKFSVSGQSLCGGLTE